MEYEDTPMDDIIEPGGKRRQRTQSLEVLSNAREAKRRARYLTMAEMSATANTSHPVKAAYVVD